MAVGPGVDVAFSSPTPIGHMDRVWWAGVAYSPKAPEWLVGVCTPCLSAAHCLGGIALFRQANRGRCYLLFKQEKWDPLALFL